MSGWTNDTWSEHRDRLHAYEEKWREDHGIERPTGITCRLCYTPVRLGDDHEKSAHPEWWALFSGGPSMVEMADLIHEGHDHHARPCGCMDCECPETITCDILGPQCTDCMMADLRGRAHPGRPRAATPADETPHGE